MWKKQVAELNLRNFVNSDSTAEPYYFSYILHIQCFAIVVKALDNQLVKLVMKMLKLVGIH